MESLFIQKLVIGRIDVMTQEEYKKLFAYISDFYRAVDTKLNYLTSAAGMLRDHMTCLYALEHDAYSMSPATGHLKLKQDACLKLLRMIDSVLRKNGIQYFLGYGNLLGAARTGNFIPWDDDVDICLMREDFKKAVEILEKEFNHDDFFTTWGVSGGIFKVLITKRVCVDLFPWDFYSHRIADDEEMNVFKSNYMRAMEAARQMEADKALLAENPDAVIQSKYNNYEEIRDELIMGETKPDTKGGDIFEGIDWQTYPERMAGFFHNKPFRHEWIFPLGEIDFCGYKFPAPNNVDAFLTTRFGDWSEFKPDFVRHSSIPFSYEELEIIRGFLREDK